MPSVETRERDKGASTYTYSMFMSCQSIFEFMYLGVATFYQERMNEFLDVAKNLEIKEISKDVEFNNDEKFNEDVEEPTIKTHQNNKQEDVNGTDDQNSDQFINTTSKTKANPANSMDIIRSTNGKYLSCDQCNKQFGTKQRLKIHIQSIHEGVKYACDQCDKQFTQQSSLATHVQSTHEGVKFACNQCDYQATRQSGLVIHIKSKHEGVKYPCNQCDYQAKHLSNLKTHIKSKH